MELSVLADIAGMVQGFALVVVGGWAYLRFRKERTHYPHMEFSIDCNFYGPHDDKKYVAEFLVSLKNRGFVQQKFKEVFLSVHAIDESDPELKTWKECKKGYEKSYWDRLFCPVPLIKNIDIIPRSYKPYVVEPGCEETIRYITPIPMNVKYMLAHAEYRYPNTQESGIPRKRRKMNVFIFLMTKLKNNIKWYAKQRRGRKFKRFIFIVNQQINKRRRYGYPRRPRTTERFIQVEPRVVYDQYALRTHAGVTSTE